MPLRALIKLLDTVERSRIFWLLLVICLLFFLLRLPSLFEPYWYGDEGIYQVIGMSLANGGLMYRDIWDNKPPLLYIFYALFHGDQFSLRFFSLLFGIGAVVSFFFLAKKIFAESKNSLIPFLTTAVFAYFFGIPVIEGNIANAENFMLFPILTAGVFLFAYAEKRKTVYLIVSGFLLSLAFLLKVVGVFDFAAFFIFLLFILHQEEKRLHLHFKPLLIFSVSFASTIVFSALFFLSTGVFWDFFRASFQQNIGYVGYGNKFIIAQGLLIIKALFLGIITVVLFLKRASFSRGVLFVLVWLSFSLFNAYFSARPYTHYLLVLLPSFVLFVGFIGYAIEQKIRGQQKSFAPILIGIVIFVVIYTAITKHFWIYGKNIPYYQNFLSFVSGEKSVEDYQSFFDRSTPRDYAVAGYLKTRLGKNDNVFIWGNNAQVYKLINKLPPGRYTVAYHITNTAGTLKETQMAIAKAKPKFLVIVGKRTSPVSLSSYTNAMTIKDTTIYERSF